MNPDSHAPSSDTTRRAMALLQAGRHAEGALALRQALDIAPHDPVALAAVSQMTSVARTWLASGRIDQALTMLAPIAGSEHAGTSCLMLYSHALMALNRNGEAESVLQRWLQKEPQNPDARLRMAAVLADSGRLKEAESMVRQVMARHGDRPEAHFVLGRALLGQNRLEEAETVLRKVVHAQPWHQVAQANLMELIWMRSGDVGEAGRNIDQALRAQPKLAGLRITKARLLVSAGQPREAVKLIDAGLALSARDPSLLEVASAAALEFDGQRALEFARRLCQVAPGDRSAHVALGNALLATGQAQAALEAAEALQRADPADGRGLALQADALRMLGDPRYHELLDYACFVRAEWIDVPSGWPDRDSYIADLVADLEQSHPRNAHPIGNSLREGSQIQLLPQDSRFASIRAYPQAIEGPIRRYMRALGQGADPLRRRNTGHYHISGMWSVRLRPNGFHVSHYHPQGWLSSACYLSLPPAMGTRGGAGWLKFGEPAFPTQPPLGPEYFIKPQPGLLVLFPAYMWHATVPFPGKPEDRRLTIAFDVVPAEAE